MKKVVENYHSLTQEDVKRLVTEPKKGWDPWPKITSAFCFF